ncbi:Uncharacterised protein [Klebsiella pneumoniae]|nr:Uncharacterised protein [Klebsiella pneumoniae]SSK37582.1 Uncharacterised protein [Klebsiella pneumoniae]
MLLPFIASFAISGCVIKPQTVGVQFCDGANPIYISKDDALTEETEREILIHNTLGERLCSWGYAM